MANFTKFLGLLKKDPVADAKDTFNIQTMLNENWDKVDEAVENKAIYSAIAAMGADGGIKNVPAISVSGILGVTEAQIKNANSGTNTMKFSLDLSQLPERAKIGYIGGLSVDPGVMQQHGGDTANIALTTSFFVNGEVVAGTTISTGDRQVIPNQTMSPSYMFPGVPMPDTQFNLAALRGKSIQPSDNVEIVVETSWMFSSNVNTYIYTDVATMPDIYIRYVEV